MRARPRKKSTTTSGTYSKRLKCEEQSAVNPQPGAKNIAFPLTAVHSAPHLKIRPLTLFRCDSFSSRVFNWFSRRIYQAHSGSTAAFSFNFCTCYFSVSFSFIFLNIFFPLFSLNVFLFFCFILSVFVLLFQFRLSYYFNFVSFYYLIILISSVLVLLF